MITGNFIHKLEKDTIHIFKTESLYLPDENEVYYASFHRNLTLENFHFLNEIYSLYFQPTLSNLSGIANCLSDIRCYKMVSGDFEESY